MGSLVGSLRLRLHPLVDGSELLRALHLALHGRLGDFHHVARAELHLLLKGSRGDAVQFLALGSVADVHTHDVLTDVEVSCGVSTLLLVLQRREERSQTVQLDGDVIDDKYGSKPEKFIEGIYRTGLAADLKIPIKGYARPHIRMPEKDKYGHWTNWSKTALPWMSIGYETQIPPISTVTFYNAIANDGIMMRPRFVKSVMKDGKVIAEFPPEKVMERRIAKPQTIKTMQTILEHVVSQGLGRKAGSRMFKVAGKTGTAQIAEGGGYKTGIVKYWLSFAGYFPADNPRYSCIVCLKKSGLPASGGGMSGVVFHHISEGVMARNLKRDVKDAHDTASVQIPDVKNGNILDANYALRQLGIPTNKSWEGSYSKGNPIWGQAERLPKEIAFKKVEIEKGVTPSVIGMGAKDAVYLLESQGLKVRIHGRGKVKSQSYPAGKQIVPGSECIISLE